MKKLLFVLAFAFIGQQSFSQMYIVTVCGLSSTHPSNCSSNSYDVVMTTIDPLGNITYDCMPQGGQVAYNGNHIALLNQKFNSILSQGYKLVSTDADNDITVGADYMNGAWYFAIP
tara:strand:- start:278 stop:625 length:348 start_codon:yes stop_codon:yes gene_type:complete